MAGEPRGRRIPGLERADPEHVSALIRARFGCPKPLDVPDNRVVLIRPPRRRELPVLQEIERAAGQRFREIGMAEIADDPPPSLADLMSFLRAGDAWVIVDAADTPVGYLITDPVDGNVHIEQVSVHPDHAGRGLGRRLLEHCAGRAAVAGVPALTLTTFVDVPWNAPYYRRCGFRIMADHEITPGLRAIRRLEASAGLDRWPRVCMRRDLGPHHGTHV